MKQTWPDAGNAGDSGSVPSWFMSMMALGGCEPQRLCPRSEEKSRSSNTRRPTILCLTAADIYTSPQWRQILTERQHVDMLMVCLASMICGILKHLQIKTRPVWEHRRWGLQSIWSFSFKSRGQTCPARVCTVLSNLHTLPSKTATKFDHQFKVVSNFLLMS